MLIKLNKNYQRKLKKSRNILHKILGKDILMLNKGKIMEHKLKSAINSYRNAIELLSYLIKGKNVLEEQKARLKRAKGVTETVMGALEAELKRLKS